MERHFLSDLIFEEFNASASDPWPADEVIMFQPDDAEQALLYEYAESLALRTFLSMCGLSFKKEVRTNAEYMSPTGNAPYLQVGQMAVAGYETIVDFVARKGTQLSDGHSSTEIADMQALQAMIHDIMLNAEKYLCWIHEPTLKTVTMKRFAFPYKWPLTFILPLLRRSSCRKQLKAIGWLDKTLDKVLQQVNECCKTLSIKLGNQKYFFGDQPTEVDALVFGHLYTLLTTELPDLDLASIVKQYKNLPKFCKDVEQKYYSSK